MRLALLSIFIIVFPAIAEAAGSGSFARDQNSLNLPQAATENALQVAEALAKGRAAYQRQDYAEATKWFRKAADLEYAGAQLELAVPSATGKGVARDDIEATKSLRIAADQGNLDNEFSLGFWYEMEQGVAQDDARAVKWSRKAAEQGDKQAQIFQDQNSLSPHIKLPPDMHLKLMKPLRRAEPRTNARTTPKPRSGFAKRQIRDTAADS